MNSKINIKKCMCDKANTTKYNFNSLFFFFFFFLFTRADYDNKFNEIYLLLLCIRRNNTKNHNNSVVSIHTFERMEEEKEKISLASPMNF